MVVSVKTLTLGEADSLLSCLTAETGTWHKKRNGVRNFTLTVLMLDAGLRVGEVVRLTTSDLYVNDEPVVTLLVRSLIAKNKTERTIPLGIRVRAALCSHRQNWLQENMLHAYGYIFYIHDRQKHISTRQVERILRKASLASIGRPIHPHVLRHTCATRLMKVSNIRTVQQLLGHKNLSSTQIYTHPDIEDMKNAIQRLDDIGTTSNTLASSALAGTGVPKNTDTPAADRNM